MSYHNWFRQYFKQKHEFSTTEEIVDDVFLLLEARSKEYLKHNDEVYEQLYVDPNEDILNSKPQIIQQVKEELHDFLCMLIDNNVKSVIQVGLGHFGSTQFCLSLICDLVVTVEYDIKNIANYADRELLYNQNNEIFIFGDSTDSETIKSVSNFGEFDCVFIDGNHSYEYVEKDHWNYSKLVKTGGIVAFHDAFLDGDRYGTPRVLSELTEDIQYIRHSKEVGIAYYIK